ncbi:DNA glycosylase [Mycena amicta]|nr:DNA glycosylase [Mycena amicta]
MLLLRVLSTMPATRSASAAAKRRLSISPEPKSPKKSKASAAKPRTPAPAAQPISAVVSESADPDIIIPADAVLTFSVYDAKSHLINADVRFKDVFARLPLKPFEELEQQISTLAARSIKHRFIRLYDPAIPEKHADYNPSQELQGGRFFRRPKTVVQTDLAMLRTAGLSQRKAEYIHDLAARFADGRLSTLKLIESDDAELAEMLIQVRGIGPWTVDMFAIFSLRRPDILPVGDLGVQRGLVRWVLSQHDPTYAFKEGSPTKEQTKNSKQDEDVLPVLNSNSEADRPCTPPPREDTGSAAVPLPPTFTPSIQRTLKQTSLEQPVRRLPDGLTVAELKSRLDGKKKVKGAFLSPEHMTALTEHWRPYRSIGVYYMWALADA